MSENNEKRGVSYSAGISLGQAIAVVMSWSLHHSIWYAIGHGIIGWIYVLIWAVT